MLSLYEWLTSGRWISYLRPTSEAVITFVVFLLLIVSLEKRDKARQPNPSCQKTNNASKYNRVRESDNHPTEGHHRAQEQEFWRWQAQAEGRKNEFATATLLISFIALGGAIYSSYESHAQAVSAQGQLRAALADQRPWIKVNLEPRDIAPFGTFSAPPELWSETFHPKIIIKNIGRSPARNIQVWLGLTKSFDFVVDQEQACIKARNGSAIMLFPGDNGDMSQEQFSVHGASIHAQRNERFSVFAYGCISYTDSSLNADYHTYFGYQVWVATQRPGLPELVDPEISLGETVLAESIRLVPEPKANYGD